MEAMVNSDNVVRGGLTPKFKDTKTLVQMLKYEFQHIKPTSGIRDNGQNEGVECTRYPTGYADFMVTHLNIPNASAASPKTSSIEFKSMAIAFILSGNGTVEIEGYSEFQLAEMKAYMILPGKTMKISSTQDNL